MRLDTPLPPIPPAYQGTDAVPASRDVQAPDVAPAPVKDSSAPGWLVMLPFVTALLSGCPSLGVHVPETVQVPVPVPCAAGKPVPPRLISDAELRALDSYSATIHLLLDRMLRGQYQARLEAALAGCWQPEEGKAGGT